jgi:hypothetical protein
MDKLFNFKDFIINEEKETLPEGLPNEVAKSALIIARGMYDRVTKPYFFQESDNYYLRFTVTELDFRYIDPKEVLPLDLSSGAMGRRDYYVELSYDDQYPSTSEVSYKIIFEPMTPDKYGKKEKDKEFIDEYEEELKRQRDEDIDIEDFE